MNPEQLTTQNLNKKIIVFIIIIFYKHRSGGLKQ